MNIKEKILLLIKKIEEHNVNYYIKENPLISDHEYDLLLKELQNLENQYPEYIYKSSPTQRVGTKPNKAFDSINHTIPMLSLSNAMSQDEIIQFDDQVKKLLDTDDKIEYVAEPKLDGVAIEVVYQNGEFLHGSTRGDGITGEDISSNIKTIKSIPLRLYNQNNLPNLLEVRGEVFIKKSDFNKWKKVALQIEKKQKKILKENINEIRKKNFSNSVPIIGAGIGEFLIKNIYHKNNYFSFYSKLRNIKKINAINCESAISVANLLNSFLKNKRSKF